MIKKRGFIFLLLFCILSLYTALAYEETVEIGGRYVIKTNNTHGNISLQYDNETEIHFVSFDIGDHFSRNFDLIKNVSVDSNCTSIINYTESGKYLDFECGDHRITLPSVTCEPTFDQADCPSSNVSCGDCICPQNNLTCDTSVALKQLEIIDKEMHPPAYDKEESAKDDVNWLMVFGLIFVAGVVYYLYDKNQKEKEEFETGQTPPQVPAPVPAAPPQHAFITQPPQPVQYYQPPQPQPAVVQQQLPPDPFEQENRQAVADLREISQPRIRQPRRQDEVDNIMKGFSKRPK